eukprot:1801811-Rhodomonas_salina.1
MVLQRSVLAWRAVPALRKQYNWRSTEVRCGGSSWHRSRRFRSKVAFLTSLSVLVPTAPFAAAYRNSTPKLSASVQVVCPRKEFFQHLISQNSLVYLATTLATDLAVFELYMTVAKLLNTVLGVKLWCILIGSPVLILGTGAVHCSGQSCVCYYRAITTRVLCDV